MNCYTNISRKLGVEEWVSAEENRNCFKIAVEGTEEDLQKFIVTNMRLVTNAIDHLTMRHPAASYLADDMFSEGLLALTRATKTLVKQLRADEDAFQIGLNSFLKETRQEENPNVIMYIYISIYRAIQRLYETDSSDCISKRMRKQFTPLGQTTPTKQIDVHEACFEQLECDPFGEIFLLEDVFDVCETDQERLVLEKRREGYRDREIAEELNCHRATVTRIKNRLHRRFRESMGLRSGRSK